MSVYYNVLVSTLCCLNSTTLDVPQFSYIDVFLEILIDGTLYARGYLIWAMSWENLFMPYANNKGADQPAHLHSLISTFVVHYIDCMCVLAKTEISRL